ncbi:IPT/TIG domain-containing protein [Methanoregula sp.]|uniref:IPT/TIG domain-containing protein n=1 Tax=Methanoregula sp. TaxID=2052170 RepID=UPI003C72F4CD
MNENLRFGMFLCLLVIAAVLIAGCSDQSDNSVATPATTAAPTAKYIAGDIIAKTNAGGDQLYVIRSYDPATDKYTRAWIYQNSDGTWGHFINTVTDTMDRSVIEKVYPVKIAHVTLSAIPVVTPTVAAVPNVTYVGAGPSISNITPASAAKDATVTVTITGNNFQTGAVPKLIQPGSAAVTGTAVSVSSTSITTTFNMYQKDEGDYNVIVTNPDGRSDILQNAFNIGNAPPVVSDIAPDTAAMNSTEATYTIDGQNFAAGVSVSFLQGSTIIPCVNPVTVDSTKVTCGPIAFTVEQGATIGLWDVKVLNIGDATSGTLTQKFTVTNSTSSS